MDSGGARKTVSRVVGRASRGGVHGGRDWWCVGGGRDARPDFGDGGKVVTDFGADSNDTASGVAIQADGKVVAAGFGLAPPVVASRSLVTPPTAIWMRASAAKAGS